jgi:hypothetical protein
MSFLAKSMFFSYGSICIERILALLDRLWKLMKRRV